MPVPTMYQRWRWYQEEAHEAGEEVIEQEMPPTYYLALHSDARLTPEERARLARGLDRTFAGTDGGHGHTEDDD